MIKENLKKQINILNSMVQAFKGLEICLVKKDLDQLSKYAVNIEELSLELLKVEEEREKLLSQFQASTLRDYLEKYQTPENDEIALLSAEVVEKLNELTIVMDGIRQLIEFENQYAGFLNNLIKGVHSPTYNISPNRNIGYTQTQGTARYDNLK
ncbi:MAG: flagellar export chaperone FlgN [Fervidobacterium sp.]